MTKRTAVSAWIVDDTGFLKQGKHSVGVQRQYTGSAGKITNCQVGVSLTIATQSDHVPVDFELYLPGSWANDPARRAEAHIPDAVMFKPKWELALDMIERAVVAGLPPGLLLADAAYGNNAEFRRRVRCKGLDYAVGINSNSTVWRLDRHGRSVGAPVAVGDLAIAIRRRGFRKTTWRQGTKTKLSSRFAAERVRLASDDLADPSQREAVWLLMEWPDSEDAPTGFPVATLPAMLTRKQLVRRIKERWRTERVYEDAKGELGLAHFEGRSFRGWHHHVSVVIACFAFIVAERIRAFSHGKKKVFTRANPPRRSTPFTEPPRAPLPQLIYHHPPRGRTRTHLVATTLPPMPPPENYNLTTHSPSP